MRIFLVVILVVLLVLGYSALSFYRKVRVSSTLAESTKPFSLKAADDVHGVSLLVIGDSTAVGVGASTPEDSLAGLVAHEVGAVRVDNFAVSGARVKDMAKEIQKIHRETYTYILVGIGANDVTHFGDTEDTARQLTVLLNALPQHSHLIVYMAGDVGVNRLFPALLNREYSKRTLAYHEAFGPAVAAAGGTYVNLYTDPADDPFRKDPQTYFAADGFHPSSAGYKLWFEAIRGALDE